MALRERAGSSGAITGLPGHGDFVGARKTGPGRGKSPLIDPVPALSLRHDQSGTASVTGLSHIRPPTQIKDGEGRGLSGTGLWQPFCAAVDPSGRAGGSDNVL